MMMNESRLSSWIDPSAPLVDAAAGKGRGKRLRHVGLHALFDAV